MSSPSAQNITRARREGMFGLREEDLKDVAVVFAVLYRHLLLINS